MSRLASTCPRRSASVTIAGGASADTRTSTRSPPGVSRTSCSSAGHEHDGLALDRQRRVVEALHRHEIVRETDEPVGLSGDHLQELVDLGLAELRTPTLEHVDEAADRGERRPHLVAGDRDQAHVSNLGFRHPYPPVES